MRICRITSEFPPPWTGLAPGTYSLSIAQQQRGLDVTLITRTIQNEEEVDKNTPFTVERVKARFDIEFSFKAYNRFKSLHNQCPFDIIHTHGFSGFGILLLKKLGLINTPIVTTFHILRATQTGITNKWKDRWALFQERFCAVNSDAICTVNDDIADKIRNGLVNKSDPYIFPVCNGVDIEKFKAKETRGNKNNQINLLFVGVLNGRKGEMDLLKAAKVLDELGINFQLSIIGDGPMLAQVKEFIASSNLSQKVRITTRITYEEMPALYNKADIFILPSKSEGMPKVALEAMASGCPVIMSDVQGCKELVKNGKNGFLVPLNKPDVLVDAIMVFFNKPVLINKMGEESRKMVENEYTWSEVAKRVEQCYYSVLKY